MDNKKAIALLEKYARGTCSPDEKKLVEAWYLHVSTTAEDKPGEPDYHLADQNIRQQLNIDTPVRKPAKQLWWPAAAAVLLIVAAAFFYMNSNREVVQPVAAKTIRDLGPGGNFATITLADGREVSLDEIGAGQTVADEQVSITKTRDGQIVYKMLSGSKDLAAAGKPAYNTIRTPHGGQYQVTLSDGTNVWLNAESSLRYPLAFSKTSREVTLTGEAFFEIKKNPNGIRTPFIVKTIKQRVEVLGTQFNVNAYENEGQIVTSLLEGRVRIRPDDDGIEAVELVPSTQGVLGRAGLAVQPCDTESSAAWKNGLFHFQHTDLKTILRQLSRWYAIDVDYNTLPDLHFNGSIPRNVKLSRVLNMFELTGNIRFRISDNKLHVQMIKN